MSNINLAQRAVDPSLLKVLSAIDDAYDGATLAFAKEKLAELTAFEIGHITLDIAATPSRMVNELNRVIEKYGESEFLCFLSGYRVAD
jgi:hypothetical protein